MALPGFLFGGSSGETSQGPANKGENATDRSNVATNCSMSKTPNGVIITQTPANTIGFFFGNSASFAKKNTIEGPASIAAGTLTGSDEYIDYGKPAAGTVLNIHPLACSGSLADIGKIVLVYKSGLSTGGI